MKIVGKIYNDNGIKLCEFTALSKKLPDELVFHNRISFEKNYLHEFDIVKIAQIYKVICEVI